jgi:tetratricopeptide (TPR) repeat protein
MAIAEGLRKIKKLPAVAGAGIATVACFFAVPYLMANENWDDHDRSNMRGARDFARNSLLSCDENAIYICNGDNDTFPVWFCQEVENVRTDVRVVNSALAGSYWHVMPLFNKVYDSEPLALTLQSKDYAQGTNDQVGIYNKQNIPRTELKQLLQFVGSDNSQTKIVTPDGMQFNYIPTNLYYVKTNKDNLLQKGLITAEQYANTPETINFDLSAQSQWLFRSDLVFLDMLGSFNFERPIFVAATYGQQSIWPIQEFAELNGVIHKFVPYYNENRNIAATGANGVNTERSYDLFMNQYSYGNLAYEKTYIDPESYRNAISMRINFLSVAQALIYENKKDKAINILDKCLEVFPNNKIAFDRNMCFFVQEYIRAGAEDKALALAETVTDIFISNINYFTSFPNKYQRLLQDNLQEAYSVLYNTYHFLPENSTNQATIDLRNKIVELLKQHGVIQS